jgi:hypothetical protein
MDGDELCESDPDKSFESLCEFVRDSDGSEVALADCVADKLVELDLVLLSITDDDFVRELSCDIDGERVGVMGTMTVADNCRSTVFVSEFISDKDRDSENAGVGERVARVRLFEREGDALAVHEGVPVVVTFTMEEDSVGVEMIVREDEGSPVEEREGVPAEHVDVGAAGLSDIEPVNVQERDND